MNLQLKNKRVFISGSTSGIGLATATLFTKEGAEVIINGRSEKTIHTAIKKIKNKNPDALVSGIVADFKNKESVNNLIEQLTEIDILINNVGIYTSQEFNKTSDSDWLDMFEVNVMSAVRLSRGLLANMIDQNWGRIINVSSECAQLVPEDLIAYSTTKTALLGLSRGLAQLTKETAVTVNAVLPGSTLSEGAKEFLEVQAKKNNTSPQLEANDFFKNIRTSSLMQRFATPDEIANIILFLASPLAAAINGASIKADGGSIGGI